MRKRAARFARYGGLMELNGLPAHKIESLYYYGSSAEWDKKPDILVNVSDVEREWEIAMACHKSQMKTKAYSNLVFTKCGARSFHRRKTCGRTLLKRSDKTECAFRCKPFVKKLLISAFAIPRPLRQSFSEASESGNLKIIQIDS